MDKYNIVFIDLGFQGGPTRLFTFFSVHMQRFIEIDNRQVFESKKDFKDYCTEKKLHREEMRLMLRKIPTGWNKE